jgi:hypothetical protein
MNSSTYAITFNFETAVYKHSVLIPWSFYDTVKDREYAASSRMRKQL